MMKEYMDQLEQKIREEFDRIAKEEENALQNSGGFIMPEWKKEELYTAIREKAMSVSAFPNAATMKLSTA